MIKLEAIVPAAGEGIRLRTATSKPLVKIADIPIIIHTLKALLRSSLIDDIIVVVESKNIKKTNALIKKFNLKRIKMVVAGGPTRSDSVKCGLKFIDKTSEFVLIHDGARPFLHKDTIYSVINVARKYGAAIVGVPVKSTLKSISHKKQPIVEATLKRSNIWEIQTPQVFKREIITKAYERFIDTDVTDDSSLVERLGVDVCVVMGSYFNIKITTPEDLILAEAMVKNVIQNRFWL